MAKPQRPHERSDSTEANDERPLTKTEAAQAMDRFKNLTRKLLKVPTEKLKAEEENYRAAKPHRRG